jgi:hypothetical protein
MKLGVALAPARFCMSSALGLAWGRSLPSSFCLLRWRLWAQKSKKETLSGLIATSLMLFISHQYPKDCSLARICACLLHAASGGVVVGGAGVLRAAWWWLAPAAAALLL